MPEPHAITRARERYGLEITTADLDRMSADIAVGRAMKLGSRPDGACNYAVMCGDRALIVVAKLIVLTVLPRERAKMPKGITSGAPKLPPKSARKRR